MRISPISWTIKLASVTTYVQWRSPCTHVFCSTLFKLKDNKPFNNIYHCNLVAGYFVFKPDLDVEKLRYNFMVHCGKQISSVNVTILGVL